MIVAAPEVDHARDGSALDHFADLLEVGEGVSVSTEDNVAVYFAGVRKVSYRLLRR